MNPDELAAGNLEADFRAIGKAAQILPAYIRIICQTRIDGRAEPELLEIAKQIALQKIETARAGMGEYASTNTEASSQIVTLATYSRC